MSARHQEVAGGRTWDRRRQLSLGSAPEIRPAVEAVLAAMAAAGYPADDVFAVRMALEEALCNAIKHGNRGDPAKRVWVRYDVSAERVLAEVEDQGPGFDPAQVPDPRSAERLGRPGGRGLLLIRQYTTWVRYNERGNCISFGRVRSGHGARRGRVPS